MIAINADSENKHFESIGGVLYNEEKSELLHYPAGLDGAFQVPSGVVEIGNMAFFQCSGLSSIELPETLTKIGARAFDGCSELIGMSIPAGVVWIEWDAFDNCSRLTNVLFLGDSPDFIGTGVFDNVASGFSVYYRPESEGFTSAEWNGYPAASAAEPQELVPLGIKPNTKGMEVRWASPEGITFDVFYSENMVDWIRLTDVAITPVGGGLAVYLDTDETRTSKRSGFYITRR